MADKKEGTKSCLQQIREAKTNSNGNNVKFLKDIFQIALNCFLAIVYLIIVNIVGVYFTIIGIIFWNDCKVEPKIPITLTVYGVISLINGLILASIRWEWIDIKDKRSCADIHKCSYCLSQFGLLISFILICIWVYGSAYPTYEPNSDRYCSKFLYWSAFLYVTFILAVILLVIIIGCCFVCCRVSSAAAEAEAPKKLNSNKTTNES